MAIKNVMVKALASFPFSPDGTTVVEKKEGDVFACPEDVAIGLKASDPPLVEDAGEGAEPTPTPKAALATTEPAVISPMQTAMAEPTKLDDKQRAELEASRLQEVPAGQGDIEPVEHGGDSIDRVLTRGADPKAVPVEDADVAAQVGKAEARAEVSQTEPEEEAQKAAEARAEEQKSLGESPENKARGARRPKP